MNQVDLWQVTLIITLWIQKSNAKVEKSNALAEKDSWQSYEYRLPQEENSEYDYYSEQKDKFKVFYVFNINDGTVTEYNTKNHKQARKRLVSSEILNKDAAFEHIDLTKPTDYNVRPDSDSLEHIDVAKNEKENNYDSENDDHIGEFLSYFKDKTHKPVKEMIWEEYQTPEDDENFIVILRRSNNWSKLSPDFKGRVRDVITSERNKLRKTQRVKRQQEQRLTFIREFLGPYNFAAKYVIQELKRVKRTGVVRDDLRLMVRILDKPKFYKVKQAVIKCYEDLKSKIPHAPTPWWLANEVNNVIINVVKDNENDGVGYK